MKMITDRPLAGKATASVEQAIQWAKANGAAQIMLDLAPLYWQYAGIVGINPVFSYCQTAYEEAFLTYKGALLDASYKNTAGIKKSDEEIKRIMSQKYPTATSSDMIPECHMRFESWEDSVKAQIDHAALYAGIPGYPKKSSETKDPRHFTWCFGIGKTVLEWAPHYATNSYGEALLKMMDALEKTKISIAFEKTPDITVTLPQLKEGIRQMDIVKTLQILLINYGFSCGICGIDGNFGKDTTIAVKNFQKARGLITDGIVGKQTWNSLLYCI